MMHAWKCLKDCGYCVVLHTIKPTIASVCMCARASIRNAGWIPGPPGLSNRGPAYPPLPSSPSLAAASGVTHCLPASHSAVLSPCPDAAFPFDHRAWMWWRKTRLCARWWWWCCCCCDWLVPFITFFLLAWGLVTAVAHACQQVGSSVCCKDTPRLLSARNVPVW